MEEPTGVPDQNQQQMIEDENFEGPEYYDLFKEEEEEPMLELK